MDLSRLSQELASTFGKSTKPVTLLAISRETRDRYADQVAALESMDWESGTPSDLDAFYEPNPALSSAGYRYLIPKVFAFCLRWPNLDKHIIDVMLMLPFLIDQEGLIDGYTKQEKKLLWEFLEEGHKLIGDDIFENHGAAAVALKAKLLCT
ncbi:hypothetical protein ABMC88_16935 [Sulfitobacter sp. HNIBRBA2951]|uniref:hypothetical protein n=1 Tax=Sulfitobacter aquimarinus TaxID=3158557 RepID=UPI0032E03B8D